MPNDDPPHLIGSREACAMIGGARPISRSTLQSLVQRGLLPAAGHIGGGRVFREDVVREFAKTYRQEEGNGS